MAQVTLKQVRQAGRYESITASINDNGDLVLSFYDSMGGDDSGQPFSEYERLLFVEADNFSQFLSAMDEENDLLASLQKHFKGDDADHLKGFMDKHEIPYSSWTCRDD